MYKDTPVLKNAIEAFKMISPKLFGEGDIDCSRYAAAGSDIIKAACVARAGYEYTFDITKEITTALESFRRVTEIKSVTDIVKIRRRRPSESTPRVSYTFLTTMKNGPVGIIWIFWLIQTVGGTVRI